MKQNFRYESRYNSKNKQYIQELVEYILSFDYGTTVPIEDCAKILHYNIDIEEELKKFTSTMSRVKAFLTDYGYILKSIRHVGFYILKPSQITGFCYRSYINRSRRTIAKSKYVMEHAKHSLLKGDRLQEYKDFLELNNNIIDTLSNEIVNSKYYDRKSYYDSLED